MDDVMLHRRIIGELKGKLENFLAFCREKNLKLKPSKLNISVEVEFGGAVISSKIVKEEQVVGMRVAKRQAYPSIFRHEETTDKKGHRILLRNVDFTTTLESKHIAECSNVKEGIRI